MKTAMLGLGSVAIMVVAWRLLAMFFLVTFTVVKFLLFVVLPICLIVWFVRKVLYSEPRKDAV